MKLHNALLGAFLLIPSVSFARTNFICEGSGNSTIKLVVKAFHRGKGFATLAYSNKDSEGKVLPGFDVSAALSEDTGTWIEYSAPGIQLGPIVRPFNDPNLSAWFIIDPTSTNGARIQRFLKRAGAESSLKLNCQLL